MSTPDVTDRAAFDKLLKDLYLGPVRDAVNRATVALDFIKPKENVQVSGRKYIIPIIKRKHTGISSRSGATRNSSRLPTAQRQDYENYEFYAKYHYGRIEVDGPSMRSSRDDRGAFAQSLDTEINGVTVALAQDLNRQIYGSGVNDLCRVVSTAGTTVTCDTTKFLFEGMEVQAVGISGGGAGLIQALTTTVVSITDETTFETADAQTATSDDGYFTPDPDAPAAGQPVVSSPYLNGLIGLKSIVSDVDEDGIFVGGISRAVAGNEFHKANVLDNGGNPRPLSLGLMQQAFLASRQNKFGGKIPDFALMGADIWATYGNILVADKRYRGETMTLDGGWEYLDYSGVKCFWDKDCQDFLMYWCASPHVFFLTQADVDFMDKDGAILSRVTDYDSYEATIFTDKELGTDMPAAHTLLTDLQVNIN